MNASDLIGKEYCSFDGKCRWELLFEEMLIVILDTGVKRGRDLNLVGIDDELRVKWVVGGVFDLPGEYDGIVSVWIKRGHVWAASWSGFSSRLDYKTGEILEQNFTK